MGLPRGSRQRRGGGPHGSHGPGFHDGEGMSSGRNHKRMLLLGADNPTGAFTLADEARSTAHGSTAWSKDTRLRSRPVSFVSAGCVDPLRQLEDQLQKKALEALGHMLPVNPDDQGATVEGKRLLAVDKQAGDHVSSDGSRAHASSAGRDMAAAAHEQAVAKSDLFKEAARCPPSISVDDGDSPSAQNESAEPVTQPQSAPTTEPGREVDDAGVEGGQSSMFFFDTTGEPAHKNATPTARTESSSGQPPKAKAKSNEPPHVSDSEHSQEEVILFKGRRHHGRTALNSRNTTSVSKGAFDLQELRSEIGFVDGRIKPTEGSVIPETLVSPRTRKKREKNEMKKNKKNRKARSAGAAAGATAGAHLNFASAKDEEDALIADYIANLQQQVSDEDMASASEEIQPERIDFASSVGTGPMGRAFGAPEPSSSNSVSDNLSDDLNGEGTLERTTMLAIASDEAEAGLEASSAVVDVGTQQHGSSAKPARRSKAQMPSFMHLSDSELESQLLMSFESSRLKKAEKRKERERLRAQGMLGSKAREDDPRVKYQTGMRLEQIADELRAFLVGKQSSLSLPPMDNQARKVIHELANKFNIKSKSTGSGDQRRPTLYRTLRTFAYSEDGFEAAISRVGRKYFPRRDRPGTSGPRPVNAHGSGNKDLSYRDGEIVGGSAPELGEGNKGRLMLEKMGWSNGTALGTTSNKGILQPVEQKVKRGKAGLG